MNHGNTIRYIVLFMVVVSTKQNRLVLTVNVNDDFNEVSGLMPCSDRQSGRFEEESMDTEMELLRAERDYYKKKYQEELDFQEYLKIRRTKGQCAGYIVMGIGEVIERMSAAHSIKTQAAIRKLINNPALSDDVKNVLADAHSLISSGAFWKQQALLLRDKDKKRTGV